MTENDILQLSIYIVSGFLIGLFLHKVIVPLISKLASKTAIKSDDLIIKTIGKWVIPWFFALGLFLGLRRIEMENRFYTWLEQGLVIFYIISVTFILAKIISGVIRLKTSASGNIIPSSSIVGNIVRVIIYCIGLVFILQSLDISVTPMLTALGVGGLAVALALQGTLSNLFAGLQIISSGNFNSGDFIKLSSGEDGFIEDITWRSTTIRAMSDHIIIVPNSKLADMIVSNYHLPLTDWSFVVEVGVSYNSDLNHVETVTKEVISETLQEVEGGITDFEPVIRFSEFGESSIKMKAILRVNDFAAQFAVKSEFIKKIHERYHKEGIHIPYPTHSVLIKKEA